MNFTNLYGELFKIFHVLFKIKFIQEGWRYITVNIR